MRICASLPIVALVLGIGFPIGLPAQEKRSEVLLQGQITCARCELGLTKKCASVIVVKEGTKDAIYWFDVEANKQYHAEICSESRPGEVTGFVTSAADGKQIITVSKLKFK